jgi:hypothetical protein
MGYWVKNMKKPLAMSHRSLKPAVAGWGEYFHQNRFFKSDLDCISKSSECGQADISLTTLAALFFRMNSTVDPRSMISYQSPASSPPNLFQPISGRTSVARSMPNLIS